MLWLLSGAPAEPEGELTQNQLLVDVLTNQVAAGEAGGSYWLDGLVSDDYSSLNKVKN